MSDIDNKYIVACGSSDDTSYGRCDVTDVSTKYNMLTTNPLSDENAPEMNSYSSDGSYNQDIFGWKCFNSPVSFRNGIYGECGAIISSDDFYIYTDNGDAAPAIDSGADADISTKSGVSVFNYRHAKILCGNAFTSKYVVQDNDTQIKDADSVCIIAGNSNCDAVIRVASTETSDNGGTSRYSEIIIKSNTIYLQTDSDNCCSVCNDTIGAEHVNKVNFIGNKRWIVGSSDKRLDKIYISDADITNISCTSYIAEKSKSLSDSNGVQLTSVTVDSSSNYSINPNTQDASVNSVSLGSVADKFKNVCADNLVGVIPHVSDGHRIIPLGAICVFKHDISPNVDVKRGGIIKSDSGTLRYYPPGSNTGTIISLYYCDLNGNYEDNDQTAAEYGGSGEAPDGTELCILTWGKLYTGAFLAMRIK